MNNTLTPPPATLTTANANAITTAATPATLMLLLLPPPHGYSSSHLLYRYHLNLVRGPAFAGIDTVVFLSTWLSRSSPPPPPPPARHFPDTTNGSFSPPAGLVPPAGASLSTPSILPTHPTVPKSGLLPLLLHLLCIPSEEPPPPPTPPAATPDVCFAEDSSVPQKFLILLLLPACSFPQTGSLFPSLGFDASDVPRGSSSFPLLVPFPSFSRPPHAPFPSSAACPPSLLPPPVLLVPNPYSTAARKDETPLHLHHHHYHLRS